MYYQLIWEKGKIGLIIILIHKAVDKIQQGRNIFSPGVSIVDLQKVREDLAWQKCGIADNCEIG